MNRKIQGLTTAIKALERVETGYLVTYSVYEILEKYGVSGRMIGLFDYVKINKPPAENLEDILTELRKTLVEEVLKECMNSMSLAEVDDLMERLEEVVNVEPCCD